MYRHKLLIANPMITDPVFAGTVVFLFRHNEKGAQGIILNAKEVGKVGFGYMKDIFNTPSGSFDEAKDLLINGNLQSVPLFMGGPCHTPGIFFLHGHEELLNVREGQEQGSEYDLGIPASFDLGNDNPYQDEVPSPIAKLIVTEGLYFGTPFTFGSLIEAGKLQEDKFRFFTGMSTWADGQLEHEIQNGAWTVVDPTVDVFFSAAELDKLVQSVADKKPITKAPLIPKTPKDFNSSWN